MGPVAREPAAYSHKKENCGYRKQQQVGPGKIARDRKPDKDRQEAKSSDQRDEKACPQRPVKSSSVHPETPHMSSIDLKPPYAIRLTSKGIGPPFIIFFMRGSLITLPFTLSRCARDLKTINEKRTVSPGFSLIVFENEMPNFTSRSSPTASTY